MSEEQKLKYSPLNSNTNEIRLVRLKPLKYNRDNQLDYRVVACQLEHVNRTKPVKYVALSYAWEHGIKKQQILINGAVHYVSANLVDALRQLRDNTADVLLWVDQICINQTDELEKGQQVQEMKSIYESALNVVVWLGNSLQNSDLVMTMLDKVGKYFWDDVAGSDTILEDIARTMNHFSASGSSDYKWDGKKVLAALPDAFDHFCQREYWKRLWVIQEFSVAPDIVIVCGNAKVPHIRFNQAWRLLEQVANAWLDDLDDAMIKSPIFTIAQVCVSYARSFGSGVQTRRNRYQSTKGKDRDSLLSVMGLNLTLVADYNQPLSSDPRDRVFSLLGLTGENFDQFPDYTKSTEEIYEELSREFFRRGYIDQLVNCQFPRQPRERPIASWAVDWFMQIREPVMRDNADRPFNASSGTKQDKEVHMPDSQTVVLRGVYVDSVKSIGALWDPNWLKPLNPHHTLDYLRCIKSFCSSSSRIRIDDEDIDCARIAMGDKTNDVTFKSQMDRLYGYQAALKYLERGEELPQFKPGADRIAGGDTELAYASTYASWLRSLHSRRPFISSSGYVGLAPSHVEEGDTICILLGGRAAYMLRPHPVAVSTHIVVGEAYVHGIMYGEFMKSNPEVTSFVLM